LLHCPHFTVWRLQGDSPFPVGAVNTPRVLVAIAGQGELDDDGRRYPFGQGDVVLLPAEVGACSCRPADQAVILLEVALPE
jgi:mannose-6-phosphate isomerase